MVHWWFVLLSGRRGFVRETCICQGDVDGGLCFSLFAASS